MSPAILRARLVIPRAERGRDLRAPAHKQHLVVWRGRVEPRDQHPRHSQRLVRRYGPDKLRAVRWPVSLKGEAGHLGGARSAKRRGQHDQSIIRRFADHQKARADGFHERRL
jgi:hypothetical protein